jgi:hypothetical protein
MPESIVLQGNRDGKQDEAGTDEDRATAASSMGQGREQGLEHVSHLGNRYFRAICLTIFRAICSFGYTEALLLWSYLPALLVLYPYYMGVLVGGGAMI